MMRSARRYGCAPATWHAGCEHADERARAGLRRRPAGVGPRGAAAAEQAAEHRADQTAPTAAGAPAGARRSPPPARPRRASWPSMPPRPCAAIAWASPPITIEATTGIICSMICGSTPESRETCWPICCGRPAASRKSGRARSPPASPPRRPARDRCRTGDARRSSARRDTPPRRAGSARRLCKPVENAGSIACIAACVCCGDRPNWLARFLMPCRPARPE